jgi:release factor glutamine methyltransferase
MRKLLRYIVGRTYKPLLVKYLSGTTTYTYKNIRLQISPGVFHPGFFFSTKLLLKYISTISLAKKTFLELGAGSGLISIYAAQKGAHVTATDINHIAISGLKKNSHQNKTPINIIESDLFAAIPKQSFDVIAINPPYYKKNPVSDKDYAWYCGENGEFFQNVFKKLHDYIHAKTELVMVLCDGCDIEMIKTFASGNGFYMRCVFKSNNMIEKNFIYKIEKAA